MHISVFYSTRLLWSVALSIFLLFCGANVVLAQISTTPSSFPYPAIHFVYTQNFSNLPASSTYASGITNKGPYFLGSLHPGLQGLFMVQTSGTNASLNFANSSGSNATSGIFSYGATSAATRALGSLASSAGTYVFGISFTNTTSAVIEQFEIEFVAAQWRKGGSGKANEWTFLYHTSGTNNVLDTLTKKDTILNFTSVQTSTGTAALNGLLGVNQQKKKDTLTNLQWKPGEQLILKWLDKDEVGNDDGMALQQLICKALTMPDNTAPTVFAMTPPPVKTYTTGDTITVKIIFSEPCILNNSAFNPYLVATISDSAKKMAYTKGSGTNEWYFSYIITKGNLSKNGLNIYPAINSEMGAITDAALNNCNGVITSNTHFLQVKIDAVAPAFIDTRILHLNSCKRPLTIDPVMLGVTQTDSSETISWKVNLTPRQGEILGLPFSSKTVGDSSFPKNIVFIPTNMYAGLDSAIIEISDGINSSFKTILFQLDSGIVDNKIIGDQIICKGFLPTLFTGNNPANTSYYWICKEYNEAAYKPATGINSSNNYQSSTIQNSSLFKRIASRFSCIDTSHAISVQVKNNGLWIGANGAVWQIGSNWCGGLVPDSSSHVLIQQGSQIIVSDAYPNQTSTAKTITIDSTASIIVNGTLYWPLAIAGTGNIDVKNGSIYIEKDSTVIQPNIFKNNLIYNLQIDAKNKVDFLDSLVIANSITIFNGVLQAKHLTLLHAAQINSSGNNTQIMAPSSVYKKYNLADGQTKLLALPFSNISSLKSFQNSIAITGSGGRNSGFDSANHETPSAFYLDSTFVNYGKFIYKPFNKIDSSFWEPNSAVKIWLYPKNASLITETPFVVSKKQDTIVDVIAHGIPQHGPLEMMFPVNPITRYYLTGNPYPAAIDISKITSSSSIGKYYWYWDAGLGTTGNYTAGAFRHPRIIEKLEGFVIKNTAASSGYLFYDERTKININDSIDTTRYKQEYPHISLQFMQENNLLDKLEIVGIDSASSRFEKWDAEKINENEMSLYTISRDSIPLCIDARPFTNNVFVPIGMLCKKTGKYKLLCTAYVIANDMIAYLHDKRLNKYQKIIQDSSYAFEITSDTTTVGEHRFEITGPPPPPIQENPILATVTPNPVQNQLRIQFSFREALPFEIAVHTISGVMLITKKFAASKTGTAGLAVHTLLPGQYFAIVKAGKHYVQKQFIKL